MLNPAVPNLSIVYESRIQVHRRFVVRPKFDMLDATVRLVLRVTKQSPRKIICPLVSFRLPLLCYRQHGHLGHNKECITYGQQHLLLVVLLELPLPSKRPWTYQSTQPYWCTMSSIARGGRQQVLKTTYERCRLDWLRKGASPIRPEEEAIAPVDTGFLSPTNKVNDVKHGAAGGADQTLQKRPVKCCLVDSLPVED